MSENRLVSLKEAQRLYGIENTTFPKPRFVSQLQCAWCGRSLASDNASGFCNKKCAGMYRVNTTKSGENSYRLSLLYRDRFTCKKCGQKHSVINKYNIELPASDGLLDLHHIVPKAKGGSDDPSNLVTWCRSCHELWHDSHNDGFKSPSKRLTI